MKQRPKNFNGGSPSNPFDNGRSQSATFSTERTEAAKKQARKWFAILLIIGLALGGVVAVGVVKMLTELGLTDKPNRPLKIEMQQIDRPRD